MGKVLKGLIIFVIVFLVIFGGFAALGFYRMYEKEKTQAAIDKINSRKITLDDVMGKNLPPKPDQQLNDSTIAGIDANNNAIRDDVELEIFARYPNSAKIRAAMLQYAQALQLELTEVFNSETLAKILQRRGYSQSCIDEAISEQKSYPKVDDDKVKEVENLALNLDIRKKRQVEVFNKYMTAYSIPRGQQCDINLSSLPN